MKSNHISKWIICTDPTTTEGCGFDLKKFLRKPWWWCTWAYPSSLIYIVRVQGAGRGGVLQPHPTTSCSTSRYGMILKFVPEIPFVKWWQLVMTSATGSRDWYVIYRLEADFWWFLRYWKWLYQSSFIKDTYFGKFKSLIMSLAWETKKLL